MEPEVHYRIHKDPPLVPIRSHTNPVHSLPLYFPDIHFNIIFSSILRPSKLSLPSRFSYQNFTVTVFICVLKVYRNDYFPLLSLVPLYWHMQVSNVGMKNPRYQIWRTGTMMQVRLCFSDALNVMTLTFGCTITGRIIYWRRRQVICYFKLQKKMRCFVARSG